MHLNSSNGPRRHLPPDLHATAGSQRGDSYRGSGASSPCVMVASNDIIEYVPILYSFRDGTHHLVVAGTGKEFMTNGALGMYQTECRRARQTGVLTRFTHTCLGATSLATVREAPSQSYHIILQIRAQFNHSHDYGTRQPSMATVPVHFSLELAGSASRTGSSKTQG
jgi:hypothetical protein